MLNPFIKHIVGTNLAVCGVVAFDILGQILQW